MIGMTASDMIVDASGNELSVLSIDFGMTNFVEEVFQEQDIYNDTSIYEGYSVLFHSDNYTVFYHKLWNRTGGIEYSWPDLEYKDSSDNEQADKSSFTTCLDKAIAASLSLEEVYFQITEKLPFFFNYTKSDISYLGVVYPVQVQNLKNNANVLSKQPVMYLARIQRNIVEYLLDDILHYSSLLIYLTISESIIIVILTLVSLLHLTAILVGQIYIPIEAMTLFLKQNSLLLQKSVSKQHMLLNLKALEIQQTNREYPKLLNTQSPTTKRRFSQNNQGFRNQLSNLQSPLRSKSISQFPQGFFGKDNNISHNDQLISNRRITFNLNIDQCTNELLLLKPTKVSSNQLSLPIQQDSNKEIQVSLGLNPDPVKTIPEPPSKSFHQNNQLQQKSQAMLTVIPTQQSGQQTPNNNDSQIIFMPSKQILAKTQSNSPTAFFTQNPPSFSNSLLSRRRRVSSNQNPTSSSQSLMNPQQKVDVDCINSSSQEIIIIKQTFSLLMSIINFERDDGFNRTSKQTEYERVDSLFKFVSAARTFSMIGNSQALVLCYFHIAQVHSEESRFEEAFQAFEASLINTLMNLDCLNLPEFRSRFQKGNINFQDFFFVHLRNLIQTYSQTIRLYIQTLRVEKYQDIQKHDTKNISQSNNHLPHSVQLNTVKEDNLIDIALDLLSVSLEIERKFLPLKKSSILFNFADRCELFIYKNDKDNMNFFFKKLSQQLVQNNNIQEDRLNESFDDSSDWFQMSNTNEIDEKEQTILKCRIQFLSSLMNMSVSLFAAAESFTQLLETTPQIDNISLSLSLCSLQFIFDQAMLVSPNLNKYLTKALKHQLESSYDDSFSFDIVLLFFNGASKQYLYEQLSLLFWLQKTFLDPTQDRLALLSYSPLYLRNQQQQQQNLNQDSPLLTSPPKSRQFQSSQSQLPPKPNGYFFQKTINHLPSESGCSPYFNRSSPKSKFTRLNTQTMNFQTTANNLQQITTSFDSPFNISYQNPFNSPNLPYILSKNIYTIQPLQSITTQYHADTLARDFLKTAFETKNNHIIQENSNSESISKELNLDLLSDTRAWEKILVDSLQQFGHPLSCQRQTIQNKQFHKQRTPLLIIFSPTQKSFSISQEFQTNYEKLTQYLGIDLPKIMQINLPENNNQYERYSSIEDLSSPPITDSDLRAEKILKKQTSIQNNQKTIFLPKYKVYPSVNECKQNLLKRKQIQLQSNLS